HVGLLAPARHRGRPGRLLLRLLLVLLGLLLLALLLLLLLLLLGVVLGLGRLGRLGLGLVVELLVGLAGVVARLGGDRPRHRLRRLGLHVVGHVGGDAAGGLLGVGARAVAAAAPALAGGGEVDDVGERLHDRRRLRPEL